MIIDQRFHVAAPPDAVWKLLKDLPHVCEHIPGLRMPTAVDDRTHRATVTTRLGPTVVNLDFVLTMEAVDDAARTAVISFNASDSAGKAGVDAKTTVAVSPAGVGSDVILHVDVELSGLAATYGSGLLNEAAAHATSGFAANLERTLRH